MRVPGDGHDGDRSDKQSVPNQNVDDSGILQAAGWCTHLEYSIREIIGDKLTIVLLTS